MDRTKRAYALIEMKRLDAGARTFSGLATNAAVDRMNDVINPLGARFTNPLALLRGHDSDQPIGTVTFKKPTKDGIAFEAEIPIIAEPGPLKDRCDMAWGEVANGIVRAVSVGFRPLKWSFNSDGGTDFEEVEIIELSTVPIPANAAAQITSVGKSMDAKTLALIKSFDVGASRKSRERPPVRLDGNRSRIVRLEGPSSTAKGGGRVVRLSRFEKLMMAETKASERRRKIYAAAGIKTTRPVRLTAEDLARARRGR
jgi:HK97 family phage prohead protease